MEIEICVNFTLYGICVPQPNHRNNQLVFHVFLYNNHDDTPKNILQILELMHVSSQKSGTSLLISRLHTPIYFTM